MSGIPDTCYMIQFTFTRYSIYLKTFRDTGYMLHDTVYIIQDTVYI